MNSKRRGGEADFKKNILFFLLFITFGYGIYLIWPEAQNSKEVEAEKSYKEAEAAKTAAAKERGFNRALQFYLEVEDEGKGVNRSSKLEYDIANTFFQLGEYSQAVLYYYRALASNPRNEKARYNLSIALEKLGLPAPLRSPWWQRPFLPYEYLSKTESYQLFTFFLFLAFLTALLYLYSQRVLYAFLAGSFMCVCLLLVCYLAWQELIAYPEAVVVKSTLLYSQPDEQYGLIDEDLVKAGSKVVILNSLKQGRWVQLMMSDERIGFVPESSLELI